MGMENKKSLKNLRAELQSQIDTAEKDYRRAQNDAATLRVKMQIFEENIANFKLEAEELQIELNDLKKLMDQKKKIWLEEKKNLLR